MFSELKKIRQEQNSYRLNEIGNLLVVGHPSTSIVLKVFSYVLYNFLLLTTCKGSTGNILQTDRGITGDWEGWLGDAPKVPYLVNSQPGPRHQAPGRVLFPLLNLLTSLPHDKQLISHIHCTTAG